MSQNGFSSWTCQPLFNFLFLVLCSVSTGGRGGADGKVGLRKGHVSHSYSVLLLCAPYTVVPPASTTNSSLSHSEQQWESKQTKTTLTWIAVTQLPSFPGLPDLLRGRRRGAAWPSGCVQRAVALQSWVRTEPGPAVRSGVWILVISEEAKT